MALPQAVSELFKSKGSLGEDDLTVFFSSSLGDDLARKEARRILDLAGVDTVDEKQFAAAAQAEAGLRRKSHAAKQLQHTAGAADASDEDASAEGPIQDEDICAIFDLADLNGDNAITVYELSGALKSIGVLDTVDRAVKVSEIMLVLDTNNDGVVSRDEFLSVDRVRFAAFFESLQKISVEDGIQGMLEDIWDANFHEDGRIGEKELRIGEKELRTLLQIYGEASVEESANDAQDLMGQLDAKGNGSISRNEFIGEVGCRELPRLFSHTPHVATRRGSVISSNIEQARLTREATEESFEQAGDDLPSRRNRRTSMQSIRAASTVLNETMAIKRNRLAYQDITEEKIYQMHALFTLVDAAGSETICFDEFKHILTDNTITGIVSQKISDEYYVNLFEKFDVDDSGELDFKEFLQAFGSFVSTDGKRYVSQTFAQADHNELVREADELQRNIELQLISHRGELEQHKELEEELEEELEQQGTEYSEKIAHLTAEESSLRQRVSEISSSLEEASDLLEAREEELADIKTENGRLHKALEEEARRSKQLDTAIPRLQERIKELEDENFRLRASTIEAVPADAAEIIAKLLAEADTKDSESAAAIEELEIKLASSEMRREELETKLQEGIEETKITVAAGVGTKSAEATGAQLEDELKGKLAASESDLAKVAVDFAALEVSLFEEQELRLLVESQLQALLVDAELAKSAKHDNEVQRKTIASQLDGIKQLQIDLAEKKGMSERIHELEDEVLQVRNAAHIDEREIQGLVSALEESKSSLDLQLEHLQDVQKSDGAISEDFVPAGVWHTELEHAGLTKGLEESAIALEEAQIALQRSSDEVHTLRTTGHSIQSALSEALANGGDVEALKAQLRIVQSQLSETEARCTELENDLADALSDLEKAQNDANRDNTEVFLSSLQREIDALTAERDAAVAREQICQTELEHIRQRRNGSASAAYTDLLEGNEVLQDEVDALEEALRVAGDGGEQDELIEALVREIATLKGLNDQAHAARITSLERRLDRVGRGCTGGCNNGNVTQEVRLTCRPVPKPVRRPNNKQLYRRRFFIPGKFAPSALPKQESPRTNIRVKMNKMPSKCNPNVADMVGKQAWFRLDQKRIGLVDGKNNCFWSTTAFTAPEMTNQSTISFLVHGEQVSLKFRYPHLAKFAHSSLQKIVSN